MGNRYGALILAGIFFGTTGTAQALGPDGLSPLAVGSGRLIFGAFFLWIITRFTVKTAIPIAKKDLWLASIGFNLYQLTFFSAVKSTGVTIGTVTALGSAPALTGIIAFILKGEKASKRWFLATIVTTCGIAVLSSAKGFSQFNLTGFLLALGAGASYSLFAVASKSALSSGIGIPEAMTKIILLASILGLPFIFVGDFAPLISAHGIEMLIWLGLVPTALAYLAYAFGLVSVQASTASTLILAEPATATVLAALVLHESLNLRSIYGIAIIVCGVVYLSREKAATKQ